MELVPGVELIPQCSTSRNRMYSHPVAEIIDLNKFTQLKPKDKDRFRPENLGNYRNMEAGIRCSDSVPEFFRFRREPIRIEHNRSLDTGLTFLLPNTTIFQWFLAQTVREVIRTGLRNH
jgi:hypothetical protein